MKSDIISVNGRLSPSMAMGDFCYLHPHFIYDPESEHAKLFMKDVKQVQYVKSDVETGYCWVQEDMNSPQIKVRSIQLIKPSDKRFA